MRGLEERGAGEAEMARGTFMTLSAAASLVYGVAGLVAAPQLAARYGVSLDPQSEIVVRFLAAAYLGYAVTNWLARHTTDPVARSAIVRGNFTGWAISVAVALHSIWLIGGNAFNVGTLMLQTLVTLGWGRYVFRYAGPHPPARERA